MRTNVGSGLASKQKRLHHRRAMTNAMKLLALPILILASPMGCSSQPGHPGDGGAPQGGASATGGVGSGGASGTAGTGGKGSGQGGASATGGASAASDGGNARSQGAGQCRLNSDCPGGEACLVPGAIYGFCDSCSSDITCRSDSDCHADGGTMVCGPYSLEVPWEIPCVCPGTATCIPPCTDNTCNQGEVCSAGHCIVTPCQTDADCPVNHQCVAGSCGRNGCSTDADCTGYCVVTKCYSTPGRCTPVP
jgi:hypothetical protein